MGINPNDYRGQALFLLIVDCKFPKTIFRIIIILIIVIILLTVLPIAYGLALYLLVKRKDFQPLKSRSMSLILISTSGNALFLFLLLTNKIIDSNYWQEWQKLSDPSLTSTDYSPGLSSMIYSSCEIAEMQMWFAQNVIFFPYLFRAIRLF